jgi:hypothetical protein
VAMRRHKQSAYGGEGIVEGVRVHADRRTREEFQWQHTALSSACGWMAQ